MIKKSVKTIVIVTALIIIIISTFFLVNNVVKDNKLKHNTATKEIYLTNDNAIDIVKKLVESSDSSNNYTYTISEENKDYLLIEVKDNNDLINVYKVTYTTDSDGNKILDCVNRVRQDNDAKTLTIQGELD